MNAVCSLSGVSDAAVCCLNSFGGALKTNTEKIHTFVLTSELVCYANAENVGITFQFKKKETSYLSVSVCF